MPDSESFAITRADELNAVGAKLFGQNQIEAARLHFLAALYAEPNHAQALQNLGAALRQLNHYEVAASVARRSVVASNNNPYCRSNLGVSQIGLRQFDEALITLRSVLDDLPNSGPSWHNYGLALYMTNQHEEALAAFNKGLALDPDNVQAQSDRALSLLCLGELQLGLAAYESRWKLLWKSPVWNLDLPEWQGEELSGCRLLVHHEQGFGDSIMLSRWLKELPVSCRVTLAVPNELHRLFERSFPFVQVIGWDGDQLNDAGAFDYHSPLLSIMRWLNIKSPSEIDPRLYIVASPMAKLTLPKAKLHVGICWASGNHGPTVVDRRRIVPLTQFLPLTELPGVLLVSLQKGDANNDISNNGLEGIVYDVGMHIDDFADTADVISQLDLVISVDSAVAHLAGAVGKPCLMLGPFTRCWRWWNESSGLPWYNDMMQFNQSKDGTWNDAMQEITATVAEILSG